MKKTTLSTAALLASLGLATTAFAADQGLTQDELSSLLDSAQQYGFTHFEEISVDDGNELELEGWREDGWKLEVDMNIASGDTIKEEQRQDQIPDWGLSFDEVNKALDSAMGEGLQRFESLEVESSGSIEIEGYNDQNQEIEIYLNSSDFSVTGVTND